MQKFKIITLGCKVNQAESAGIARQLRDRYAAAGADDEPVNLCIINTCTVTGKASMQSRQAVRQALRAYPKARIVVTGCYAQTAPDDISSIPGVDLILGNDGKHRIVQEIGRQSADSQNRIPGSASSGMDHWIPGSPQEDRARAFVKIQDGCNARCSYCIVPTARGASRSLPVADALQSIQRLAEDGYPEAVLTGIHLGHYGLDLDPPSDLLTLLKYIRQQQYIQRVRLSSIEPPELTADLIRFTAGASDRPAAICPHFHIPLQSGDNEILRRMHRPYTREFFQDLVQEIRHHLPDASLGIDVLVGFPGETDAAFENTCELLQQLPVTYLHVFPFSRRKGTAAEHMPDQVPPATLKARCRRIRYIGFNKKLAYYNRFHDKILEVVVESFADAATGQMKGTSANYIPVTFTGHTKQLRTIVSVRVDRIDPSGFVFGTVVP